MNNYYHLPIYKEAYGLLTDIFKRVKKLDREYKYTIGEQLKEECLNILKNVYKASKHKGEKKDTSIEEILDSIIYIKVLLRILKDLGVMSAKNHSHFSQKAQSLSNQATGWQRHHARVL